MAGGTVENDGVNGQGTGSDGGTQTGGQSGGGEASQSGSGIPSGLDRSKLNPLLQGMSEEQLNEVFDTMFEAVRGRQAAGAPETPREPPPKPDYKEMLDPASEKYNPEAAFGDFVQRNYGGLIGDIRRDATEGLYAQLRQQFPDFKEFEPDVKRLLANRDPLTVGQADILNHYYLVKGFRSTQQQSRPTPNVQGNTTVAPSPERDEETGKLSAEEVAWAHKMFPNSKDPVAEYKKYAGLEFVEVNVPVGGGKKA